MHDIEAKALNSGGRIMDEADTTEPDELGIAITTAKRFLRQAFKDEQIENLALEEVRPPEAGTIWEITLGFNHKFEPNSRDLAATIGYSGLSVSKFLSTAALTASRAPRVYKTVRVDAHEPKAISITNWKQD